MANNRYFWKIQNYLLGIIDRPGLSDNSHSYLPWILHGLLNLFGDISCKADGSQIINVLGFNEDSYFTTGLQSVRLFYSFI